MANFFGRDRFKEGPGVEKDAPPLPPVKQFFAILARKFWYFVRFNFLYIIVSIPGLILSVTIASVFMDFNFSPLFADKPELSYLIDYSYLTIAAFLVCIPAIAIGPFQAGLTYILRGFVREEPTFFLSDFVQTIKKNWKQSLVVGLINLAVIAIIALDISVYRFITLPPILKAALFGFLLFILLVFLMMQMYLYPMIITFKLSLRKLYKNAFLFTMIKFFPNFGLMLVTVALIVLAFLGYNPLIGIFLYLVILPALIGFMNTSFAYRTIKHFMIDNEPEAPKK